MRIKILVDGCVFNKLDERGLAPETLLISDDYYLAVSKAVLKELARISDELLRLRLLALAGKLPVHDTKHFGFTTGFGSAAFIPDKAWEFLERTSRPTATARPGKDAKNAIDRYQISQSVNGGFLTADKLKGLKGHALAAGVKYLYFDDFTASGKSFTEWVHSVMITP